MQAETEISLLRVSSWLRAIRGTHSLSILEKCLIGPLFLFLKITQAGKYKDKSRIYIQMSLLRDKTM